MNIKITSGVVSGVLGGVAAVAVATGNAEFANKLLTPAETQFVFLGLSAILSIAGGILPGLKNYVYIGDDK